MTEELGAVKERHRARLRQLAGERSALTASYEARLAQQAAAAGTACGLPPMTYLRGQSACALAIF